MNSSQILSLPYLQPSQAQKHVTHNEALRRLDILVQLVIEGVDALDPPALPEDGTVWALGTGTTGAWAGQDGQLAARIDGVWEFITPQAGWQSVERGTGLLRVHDGTAWGQPPVATDNLDGVGVNTTSDTTNRLAVAADATLLSHDSAGHQLKINKAAAADTGSLLFQTGWSGRAEMGLAGDDNFAIKVSADGNNWTTALCVDAANGWVGVGVDTPQESLHIAQDTVFGSTSGGTHNGNIRIIPGDQYPRIQAYAGSNAGNCQILFDIVNGAQFQDIDDAGGFLQWRAKNGGSHDNLMRLTRHGHLGIGTAAPERPLHVRNGLRLEPGPAPANPEAGDLYFDNTTLKLRCHDGTIWQDLF